MPGEELLEARDVLPEVPVIDGEILPEGRPQGVELPDVGRPDLGDEGQPVEMDEHAAAVAEGLERDEVDGRLAPDQERPSVPLPVLQLLPVDLVGGAQDVAVPGFDEAVPVAERDAFVLGVETGLPEEREEVRGLGREVRDVEPGLARLQRREHGGERLAGLAGLPAQRRQAFRVVVPRQDAREDERETGGQESQDDGRADPDEEGAAPSGPASGPHSLSARISTILKAMTGAPSSGVRGRLSGTKKK